MRDGRLSETQVKEIASAAILQPEAERELVEAAEKQPLNVLKLVQSGEGHRPGPERLLRIDSSGSLSAELDRWRRRCAVRRQADPRRGGPLLAAVTARADQLAMEAKRSGLAEPRKALAADALVGLACGDVRTGAVDRRGTNGPGGPRREPTTMVHVRVDHEALVRGQVGPGEICEIPGIGPIPVEVARVWPSIRS